MNTKATISETREYRRLMDFQAGDIVCMADGEREVVEVRACGSQINLIYIERARQKQLLGLCTWEFVARTRT